MSPAPEPKTPAEELALLQSDPDTYWEWWNRTHEPEWVEPAISPEDGWDS